jgi:2-hydroxychromene-2-carboxylate isomerase
MEGALFLPGRAALGEPARRLPEGEARFEACTGEGHADHIFGVPIFWFEGEAFWGHDRIPLLEERLTERGLAIQGGPVQSADA